ncbi:hypothetical protein DL98DRAFT_521771 [Cadophora sp. DSE1049]|nr:hypothetical protein DL98DRAFT_521771 [Cadophora sp. DSE1049]
MFHRYFLLNATLILLFDTSRTDISHPTSQSDVQPRSQLLRHRIDLIRGARDLLDDCVGMTGSPQSQIVERFFELWGVV